MKLIFLPLIIFSSTLLAQEVASDDKTNKEYTYLGATYNGTTDLDVLSNTLELGPGFSLSFGHVWTVSEKFNVSFEGEYFYMGDLESYSSYKGYYARSEVSVSSLSVNVRPIYKPMNNGFYIAAVAGIGQYTIDASVDSNILPSGSGDSTDFGHSLGAELGYEFEKFVLNLGYRMMYTAPDNIAVNLSTVSFGGRYKF
ncbi:outer membrane beta-barrel protein [Vibrio sp. M250220]|uniref:outer membrane protein n=1 Tax=Vibrio sp. M250220 TaxID=3020894 RepID=UPI002F3E3EB0